MTIEQFTLLVRDMRSAQSRYFRAVRNAESFAVKTQILEEAKKCEKAVDAAIEEIERAKLPEQKTLFK